jgi:trans-aconitate methyltransferase
MWTAAHAYRSFMGPWSRRVAGPFLDALAVPAGRTWLDVGCGVRTLTTAIAERCAPSAVVGVDASAEFVRHAIDKSQSDVADSLPTGARLGPPISKRGVRCDRAG